MKKLAVCKAFFTGEEKQTQRSSSFGDGLVFLSDEKRKQCVLHVK